MPSTPTTKSQVQAYKFVLRRMQSALVRRDAVMLHDPMRTHTRATFVGICLAAVGLVGFLVWGLISPAPGLPTSDGIVISKESGSVYVLLNNPRKLIPTFNLASARLLLLAQQQGQTQGQTQKPAPAAPAAAASVAQPTVVSDKDLQDVPKGRLMGIQDGPQLLPGDDQRISDDWAVCDAYQLETNLNNPIINNKVETTVLAGVHDLGTSLRDNQALLVRADNQKAYLIYHLTTSQNQPNTDTVRAEVDLSDNVVLRAMNLTGLVPRKITTALLNAIPEVPKLTAPVLAGSGQPTSHAVDNFTVGTVFSVQNANEDQTTITYYVQEQDGIQQIKPATAQLIRYSTGTQGPKDIVRVNPGEIPGVSQVGKIDDKDLPDAVPTVLDAKTWPVACLGWSIPAGQSVGHTTVYMTQEQNGQSPVPLPKDKVPAGYKGVQITSPSADRLKVDYFYMPPGRAAVVRGAASSHDYQSAPIYLVSDRGVKFGLPDQGTAEALGLGNQRPAPESIVRLLPDGALLTPGAALQSYDTVPVASGTFETPSQSAQPSATSQPGG